MGISRVRARRAVGLVCLALGLAAVSLSRSASGASTSSGSPAVVSALLTVRGGRLPVYAYSPTPSERSSTGREVSDKPLTIYLHGICGDPGNGCPYFRDGVTSSSWLLCPSAPTPCPGGGATWSGPFQKQHAAIERAEEEASALHPGAIDTKRPRVLVGFSQGGYLARTELRQNPGRYRGVLILGADVPFSSTELRAAGVERVALGAGRYDMTYRPLSATAARLRAQGFPVRFVDLGKVGHTYVAANDEPVLRDALAWLEEAD